MTSTSTMTTTTNNNDMDQGISKASQKYYRNPWASNIPVAVFVALLKEAKLQYGESLPLKGNDIEMFHFLTGGPLAIYLAPKMLMENLEKIKDLILNKNFIPFPPRPAIPFEDSIDYQNT